MWLLFVLNRLKENLKVAKKIMERDSESECIVWPVNIGAFYQMCNAIIKHIENRECSFSRMVPRNNVS